MSLDLDRRQRAILQEIGVRVWWPPAQPAIVVQDAIKKVAVRAAGTVAVAQISTELAEPQTGRLTPAAGLSGISDMDWPALAHAVAKCQACQLCTGRRAAVFVGADAPQQADWLVVGEPPDEAEERQGQPFADQAGQLLDNMLKAVGVSRPGKAGVATTAYVTNVVKCRPAAARNPQPQELAACENFLRQEVALVKPKVILALGRFAAQTLLQGTQPELAGVPLGKLRGQIYRYQGVPVIVSYHPAYLLRTPLDKARAWADLCLAAGVAQGEHLSE